MTASPFHHGHEKDICTEILAWSEHTLQKPNPLFNNLPACPYAKKAWQEGKVAILFKYDDNFQVLYSTISQFDDNFDLVIIVDKSYQKVDRFHEYLDELNEVISNGMFIQKDIWLMGFHPEDDPNEYLDHETFEELVEDEYAMIFVQRLSKVHEASEHLKKLGYYEDYAKEYEVEEIFNKRENLYRRLNNGNETT